MLGCAMKLQFASVSGVNSYPLNPVPANANGLTNPSALRVLEMTYTQQGGVEQYIPIISTQRFRNLTGQYTARYASYSPIPDTGAQMFGKRTLDLYPGTSTAGDTISLTCIPDVQATGTNVPCISGGLMQALTDEPIFYAEFHIALAYYATALVCQAADKPDQFKSNMALFQAEVDDALGAYSVIGEGDSEIQVQDVIPYPYSPF